MPEGGDGEGPTRTSLQFRVGDEAAEPQLMIKWLLRNPETKVCECGALGDEELCKCSAIVQRIVSRGEVVLNGKRISSDTQMVIQGDSLKLTRILNRQPAIISDQSDEDVLPQEVAMLLSMLGNEHKAYWDSRYTVELDELDHAQRDGLPDPLEKLFVWFGKMALLMTIQTITTDLPGVTTESASILDIGCGNGFFVEVLHALGCANVTGTDYSPAAVRLCKRVQKQFREQKPEVEAWGTRYVLDDVLATKMMRESFDVVNDSGTLDSIAMTLPPEDAAASTEFNPFDPPPHVVAARAQGQEQDAGAQQPGSAGDDREEAQAGEPVTTENAEEEEEEEFEQGPEEELVNGQGPRGYFRNIAALLKPEGWLVLRSCNHSPSEISALVAASGAPLDVVRNATTPGISGVHTILLRKQPPIATAPSA